MTVEQGFAPVDGAAVPSEAAAGSGRGPIGLRAVTLAGGWTLALGIAVGLAWAAACPVVSGWSEGIEKDIRGEVAFAGLGLLAGVGVAVYGLIRPGARPVAGAAVRLVGSGLAAVIAWGVGRLVGAPVLAATGVVVLWPLATALTTAVVTLVTVLMHPDHR